MRSTPRQGGGKVVTARKPATARRQSVAAKEKPATAGKQPATARKASSAGPHPGERLLLESLPVTTVIPHIDLDITDGCNLAWSYCFKNLDEPHNMSVETAKDAIEWLIRASGNCREIGVNFMGGEPMLRYKAMRELVLWGRRRCQNIGKTIRFSFTTNMTLFNDESRRWIDEYGLGVLMSLDGIPEVQDTQRPAKDGKPRAGIIKEWAKSLLRTRPNADARFTIAPVCVHRLFDCCVYMWEEIGFKSVMMADAAYEDWTEDHFRIYGEQMDKVADYLIEDFRRDGKKRMAILGYYMSKLIAPRDLGRPIAGRHWPCGAGYNYCMIDHAGNIWPCHRFDGAAKDSHLGETILLGNIYNKPFNHALSNAFRNIDHRRIFKESCKDCPSEPICGGACPAANLQHSGKLPSIYCAHEAYCRLKKIAYGKAERLYAEIRKIAPERCLEFMKEISPGGFDH